MTDLVIPGRIQVDNNKMSHWWTFSDLSGAGLTSVDLFFGLLQGGTAGMNPVMDKHYELDNVAVFATHFGAAMNWTLEYHSGESAAVAATFVFSLQNVAGSPNKSCGIWNRCRRRAPCASYHLSASGASTIFLQITAHLTWRIVSDAF